MSDLVRGFYRRVVLVALLAALLPGAASAQKPASGKPVLPGTMLDARVNLKDSYQRATAGRGVTAALDRALDETAAIRTAIADLQRTLPGFEAQLSPFTGAPSMVRNRRGALTDAAPGRASESIVRDFLLKAGRVYGLTAGDVSDLVVLGDSPGSGLRMLRMEQVIDGRPVFQSETRFLLDRQGRLVKTVGQMVPHARAVAPAVDPAKLIAPADAVARLLRFAGRTADPAAFAVTGNNAGKLELSSSDDFVKGTITARQVLFPLAPGLLVPAWSLVVFTQSSADWYAMVDAETGDLLWRKNIRAYASAHDARFRVFVQADGVTPADSPAPQSPNTVTPGSGTQFAGIAPTIVSMHTAMDATASPNGWINDCPGGVCTANETQTLGNNTLVCLDRDGTGNDVCDTGVNSVVDGNGRPTGNPDANARNRDFLGTAPRDFQTNYLPPPQGGNPEAGQTATGNGTAQTIFRRGAMTQIFYVTNWYHDQLFKLGFDEASGNFQQTNFSGMGLGNDRVLVDAQDGNSTNNANFTTPPDGTSGRAQMFRFPGPTIDRDGGLDSEVLIHELSHGTSNRLVGNAAGLNWDPGAGMGEGWSDFYAMSLLNNTNADTPTAQYGDGAYATYKIQAGFLDNYLYGIRRFPYITNNAVNPMTWADVDDVTNNLAGGIAPDPRGANFAGGMEVHNAGEVWALTLWEVRSRVIADPAGANGSVPTGNHTMLQLVTDGLKMTPVDPSFTDARDAILDADCATNACANEVSIWDGFADRGLGYGSRTPYNIVFGWVGAHMGIKESFSSPFLDVANPPSDVTIDDSPSNNNGAIDPGEAVRLTVKLTNPWRAAGKAVAGATATLTTSTPGVTIFDNTSTYGAIAPQGTATGDSFLITVGPAVPCGSPIDFTLTTTSSLGTTAVSFQLRVGMASGTDPAVTYTDDPNPNVAIPDFAPRGIRRSINVTDDFVIADLNFRIDSITHAFAGDIAAELRSPGAIGVDFISLIGAGASFGGPNITNMVADDDLAFTTANDMVQAPDASAPYTKSWLPVFNAPWATLAFGSVDPIGNLSRFDGTSTKGTWTMEVADEVQLDSGTLNAWSMIVTPVHFACTAFAPTSNVTATKTVAGTFQVGGTVTYTVTLTNNGTANQADNTGKEFNDVLPAGLTLVNATATSGTATPGPGSVAWDGALAPLGGSVTITITATVNAGTQGTTISNQGTVFYDANVDGTNEASNLTDDPGVGGAADPTTFAVLVAAESATKTVAGTFTVGGTVTYTIVLSNTGTGASPDNAGAELTDVLPASLTLVNATATSGTATPSVGTNTVTWDGSVPASGSVTITITATINAGAQGTSISNQASFAFSADLDSSNESTGTSDDPGVGGANDPTTFAVGIAAVAATKTVAGTFTVGGTVTYTVVLSNSGSSATPDNAGNELTDVLPSSLTLVNATATSGTATPTVATNTVTWNGSVPAGGSVTITITATINSGAQGTTISNQASFSYDADLDGSNETTSTSDDPAVGGANDPTNFAVGIATVAATKTVTGTFTVGSTVTYTVVLSNSGSSATLDNAGNELTDVLPSSLTLVNATATSGTATPTVATNTVTWNGSVPASGSVTITITATINSGTQGTTISNQASFSYDADLNGSNETTGTSDDPTVGGANDPTSFTVGAASISATKTAAGPFTVGSTVTYTVVISNAGASASPDNAGDEFTDVLPAALTLVNATATAGTATPNVGTNTVTWNGSVPAGGSVTITITATIKAGFVLTTVSNQGSVSFDADLNGSNETTIQTDDPAVAGAGNPTTFVVAAGSVLEIPTLSELGLLALVLLLLLAAWSQLRRRAMKV